MEEGRYKPYTMPEIGPQQLSDRIESADDDPLVLDIRPADAYEDWHIPGSENIDVYDELKSEPDSAVESLESLPSGAEVVTVCAVGKVSATATEVLRGMGYDAKTLTDGMEGWARVHRAAEVLIADGSLVQVTRPGTGCLSYVIVSDGQAAVVDPSQYLDRYRELLTKYDAELAFVLETHAHADHVSGAHELASESDVPHYLHPADATDNLQSSAIDDGDQLSVGDIDIEVIHTPGHTSGSVTLDVDGTTMLTGDTLFLDSVGRPDLEGGDSEAVRERAANLHSSLQRLLDKPDDASVLPAHSSDSPNPPTAATLEAVRERNDLIDIDQAGFVDTVATDVPAQPANHERIKRVNLGRLELEESESRRIELGPNQCAAD